MLDFVFGNQIRLQNYLNCKIAEYCYAQQRGDPKTQTKYCGYSAARSVDSFVHRGVFYLIRYCFKASQLIQVLHCGHY